MNSAVYTFIVVLCSILSISTVSAGGDPNKVTPSNGIPNDSTLFDGSGSTNSIENKARICKVIVNYVYGKADGTVDHTEITNICSEPDTTMHWKAEELKFNDTLHVGSKLKTGDNTYVQLLFWDGSEARIGPNTELEIYQDFCEQGTLGFRMGQLWMKIKRQLGEEKYNQKVDGYRCGCGVRGTEFSFEGNETTNTVACYDGSVEVKIKHMKFDKREALQQLLKDYQSGKITKEEFAEKSKELTQGIDSNTVKASVIVNAGQRCTAGDMLSDPVPIDQSQQNWFDDAVFFKK